MKNKKPLKKSIIYGCVLFILVLCMVLSVVNYLSYRHMLYERYEHYLENILYYAASGIDVDDLKQCMETGEKSEKYLQTQLFLDQLRENTDIHFLYVIVPLNTEERDNIKNVIAAVTQYEYENLADELVELNGLTGDSYSPETAEQYLTAYYSGHLSFFEEISQWGDDYTGLLPLKDRGGHLVAALCVDVDIQEIHTLLTMQAIVNVGLTVGIGAVFTLFFLIWAAENITQPIEQLESSVVEYAEKAERSRNPEELVLEIPAIHTGNEVESLANAVVRMSIDIRDSIVKIITTEQELARMYVIANHDGLTHVGNKNAYRQVAAELQKTIEEQDAEFAIVVADANKLKYVNDHYGHEKGDLYLKTCCGVLCEVFRHSPVFRIGGA